MSDLINGILPAAYELTQTGEYGYLHELERLAEIGRFSASLIHEINNPLTAAILWLDQYDNQQSSCIRHARHSMDLLQRYIEAARRQIRRESHAQHFSVQAELRHARRILEPLARRRGINFRVCQKAAPQLYGDPIKFQQIIINLVTNAIDSYGSASITGKKPTVKLNLCNQKGYLVITVTDRGCGIAHDKLEQVFKPFYSSKSVDGRGLGIGLSTIKRYVEVDFGGTVQVSSSVKQGTCFTVKLKSK